MKIPLATIVKRARVRKRYERFDAEFAQALNDPKFCKEFENFFIKHIQQKPAVKSDISIQLMKNHKITSWAIIEESDPRTGWTLS